MPVYRDLGEAVSRLTVMTVKSNPIHTAAANKYVDATDGDMDAMRRIDRRFYPLLMHGPEKHYRIVFSGSEPFVTVSSAELAAELLLRYMRRLEPETPVYEEQLMLFSDADLPEARRA